MSLFSSWLRSERGVLGINRRNLEYVFADYRPGRFRRLDDKLRTKEILGAHGVATPATLATIRTPPELERLEEALAPLDEVVIKPAKGWSGKGILVLRKEDGTWRKPDGTGIDGNALRDHVASILGGAFSLDETEDVAILEERIHPHAFFADFHDEGLADLRIVLQGGKPVQAMCRIPTRASDGKANLHEGGLGAGIDLRTGALVGGVVGDAPVEAHPDSGRPLAGAIVPAWSEVLDLAVRAGKLAGVDYLGVDMVVDRERGPLVLELNARPGLAIQIANRRAQPVAPASRPGRTDRFTFGVAWTLLALFAVAPPVLDQWFAHRQEQAVRLVGAPAGDAAAPPETAPARGGTEWDDEEVPLSMRSDAFGRARQAVAAGDTAAALGLYREAARDSAVAPFALNNVALIHRQRGDLETARQTLEEAVERYPDYFRGYYNLGLVHRDLGKDEEALADFRRVLDIRPSHGKSWAALGGLHFARKEYEEASRALEQAVRFVPSSLGARSRWGMSLRRTGDFEGAAHRFAEMLALDSGSESAAYWWVRSVRDARVAGAGADLPPADSLLAGLEAHLQGPEASARCLALAAALQWESGDWFRAMISFDKARRRSRRSSRWAKEGAVVALDLGLWGRAEYRLRRLRRSDESRDALAEIVQLGRALDRPLRELRDQPDVLPFESSEPFEDPVRETVRLSVLGRARAAARLARTVSQGGDGALLRWLTDPGRDGLPLARLLPEGLPDPGSPPSWEARLAAAGDLPETMRLWLILRVAVERGEARLAEEAREALDRICPDYHPRIREEFRQAVEDGRLDVARRLGARALTLDPRDDVVRLELAGVRLDRGQVAKARDLLEDLGEGARSSTEALVLRGRLLLAEGDPKGSVALLRKAVEQFPLSIDAHVALSRARFAQGRKAAAEEELLAALDLAPGRVDIRRLLARQLMGRKDYRRASEEWGKILGLGEGGPSDRFNRGLSLQRDGRHGEAIAEYDRLLAEDPGNYRAWFNRSLALEKLGRIDEARAGWERVLDLNPDHEPSRRKLGLESDGQGEQP